MPFADANGCYLCLDVSSGAIVQYWDEDLNLTDEFADFDQWFAAKLAVFEQAEFSVHEGKLDFWAFA